jgi:hypothetical protein
MFDKTRKPEGHDKTSSSDAARAVEDVVEVEQTLCRRLAGDFLANALFVADARLAETDRQDLAPDTRQSVKQARIALAHAARSGLVLLTSKKPGLEPHDDIDVAKRMQLAATMLRQVQEECPNITVTNGEESTLARIPVGFPSRLLARTLACFPTANEIMVDVKRSVVRGLDSIQIRMKADVDVFESWLNRIQELLEQVGGTMTIDQRSLEISLPATLQINCDRDVTNEFIIRRKQSLSNDMPEGA